MRRFILTLAVCAVLLTALFGCAPEKPQEETGWQPSATVPQVKESLLTAQEVSEAVGTAVGEGVLQEGGTVLCFTSADYRTTVSLLTEQPQAGAKEYLQAIVAQYPEGALQQAPNLGEEAYWSAETGELLVRNGVFVVSVNVTAQDLDAEAALIAARQLAALVLERL